MSKIVFKLPGKDEPGFLLRAKRALEFKQHLDEGITPKLIDEMVDFLLPFITEPVDRDEAKNAVMEATEEQFYQLVDSFSASTINPTLPGPKAES